MYIYIYFFFGPCVIQVTPSLGLEQGTCGAFPMGPCYGRLLDSSGVCSMGPCFEFYMVCVYIYIYIYEIQIVYLKSWVLGPKHVN